MKKYFFFFALIFSLDVHSYDEQVNADSHPALCKKIRETAVKSCGNDNDCYSSELSRLVDLYEENLGTDPERPALFCNY